MSLDKFERSVVWKMTPEVERYLLVQIDLLTAIAEIVRKYHVLDDLEEPWVCPTCTPSNPNPFNLVRRELYNALIEWEELENVHQ